MNFLSNLLIPFIVLFIIAILVALFSFKKIDIEWCRQQYLFFVDNQINDAIKKIDAYFTKVSWIAGAIVGFVLGVVCDFLFHIPLFWWGIILPVITGIVGIIAGFIIGILICNEYCVKHYGKMIAFVEMVKSIKLLKEKYVKKEAEFHGSSYGEQYLERLGTALNRSITKSMWFYRILGIIIGFVIGAAAGYVVVFVLDKPVILLYLLEFAGVGICLFVANSKGKTHCFTAYGHLALDFQMHMDVRSLKYSFMPETEQADIEKAEKEAAAEEAELKEIIGETAEEKKPDEAAPAEENKPVDETAPAADSNPTE